ncbi:GTP-binding protein EngA [Citrus sinensis]|nr:GTP-binding protein EngA [Citrus sinensis]
MEQAGLTAADEEIADWLRKNYMDKFIILAVNKCESPRKGIMQGTEDLVEEENRIPAIAIVGRPNVGKSSILNALVGEDRTIVSPISGTTRDAIDTEFTGPEGQKFRLIDTAGIRKRAAIASSGSTTEALSVNRAFRAIRRSDVVALVIEAMACITEQDCRIAERIEQEGKGCLIVVNKWDTIPNKNQQTATYYEQDVREKLRALDWAPIVYSTAIAGQSVDKIIVAAEMVDKERSRRLSTATINQVVQEAVAFKSPPRTRGGRRGRVYYCTQKSIVENSFSHAILVTWWHALIPFRVQLLLGIFVRSAFRYGALGPLHIKYDLLQAAVRPPTFVFFVNDAKLFPETYRRYMEKQLRADAGFSGTPIRLLWRSRRKMEMKEGKSASRTQANLVPRDRKVASST